MAKTILQNGVETQVSQPSGCSVTDCVENSSFHPQSATRVHSKLDISGNECEKSGSKWKSKQYQTERSLHSTSTTSYNAYLKTSSSIRYPEKASVKPIKKHTSLSNTNQGSSNCGLDVHKVNIFPSVKEAVASLTQGSNLKTAVICMNDVMKTSTHSLNLKFSKSTGNHSCQMTNIDDQSEYQEIFEKELKKRLQKKSSSDKESASYSMESKRSTDVYCDTPVKDSPAKKKQKVKNDDSSLASGTFLEGLHEQLERHVQESFSESVGKKMKTPKKEKMKNASVPSQSDAISPNDDSKVTLKKKKRKSKKIVTEDILQSSTDNINENLTKTVQNIATPAEISLIKKKPNIKLTILSPEKTQHQPLFINTNHTDSGKLTVSPKISSSKELGRRIRSPSVRYADDMILYPLKSPRRSRSPKGNAEKDGTGYTPEESPVSAELPSVENVVKKSSESQTSQLYSLLTHAFVKNESKSVSPSKQKNAVISSLPNGNDTGDLHNGNKSVEKEKKSRKTKSASDEKVSRKLKLSSEKSSEKTANSTDKSPKTAGLKGPSKSGAVRVLQFDSEELEKISKDKQVNNTSSKKISPVAKNNSETVELNEPDIKLEKHNSNVKTVLKKCMKSEKETGVKNTYTLASPVDKSITKSGNLVKDHLSVKSKECSIVTENLLTNQDVNTHVKSFDQQKKLDSSEACGEKPQRQLQPNHETKSNGLFALIAKVKTNMNCDTLPKFSDTVLFNQEDDYSQEQYEADLDFQREISKIPNSNMSEVVDDFFSENFLQKSPSKQRSPEKEKKTVVSPNKGFHADNKIVIPLRNDSQAKTCSLSQEDKKESPNKCEENNSFSTKSATVQENMGPDVPDTTSPDENMSLSIDVQERRNIFDAIMNDYPSPNNAESKSSQLEATTSSNKLAESHEKKEKGEIKTSEVHLQKISNESSALKIAGKKSIIEQIQEKLGLLVEESPKKQTQSPQFHKTFKFSEKSEIDKITDDHDEQNLDLHKTQDLKKNCGEKLHNTSKDSSEFEIVMDTVDDNQIIDLDSDSFSPSAGKEECKEVSKSGRPVPKTSTQRATMEPTPLDVLRCVETEVVDKLSAFTSEKLDKYLESIKQKKIVSTSNKKADPQEDFGEDFEEDIEEVAEIHEQFDEFSDIIDQCDPAFDEVDGILFTSFAMEEALNAHVKVERKTKIGKNESVLLGMARMKNIRERQRQIRNSVHKKKWARMKALKEQYKINQSLQGMHLVLMKYRRVFKRELILELMAREQESPGSIRGRTPKKTSDITQIKGWKHKFGNDEDGNESPEVKTNGGKLHWRTEERLLRNHDPEKLKEMGLDLKKKRRKNLIFTIRKGMSKGDPSRIERVDDAMEGESAVADSEEHGEPLEDENQIGQDLISMGHEILDSERQKLREKKQREKYKKYLMMKLKLNLEDIDILKKLGGQRLRSVVKPESPKKTVSSPPVEIKQETEEGEESITDSPVTKKKRKRKKNYFCIITLNSSMANAACYALHPSFLKKKKRPVKLKKPVKIASTDEKTTDHVENPEKTAETEEDMFDKLCDKPERKLVSQTSGCRYGCICHLCKFADGSQVDKPEGKEAGENICTKEYCRLGCICEDGSEKKTENEHCGKPECMLECTCDSSELQKRTQSSRSSSVSGDSEKSNQGQNGTNADSQAIGPSNSSSKTGKKAAEKTVPRRRSTYRLAKNLDAVSRKAMLYYEASEMYTSQKCRRRKQDFHDVASGSKTTRDKQGGSEIVPSQKTARAKSPVYSQNPNSNLRFPSWYKEAVNKPPMKKSKKPTEDYDLSLFDSDSDNDDYGDFTSCARVDPYVPSQSRHPVKCTCGQNHLHKGPDTTAVTTANHTMQSASRGLVTSSLHNRSAANKAEGYHIPLGWQTQWVCLKSNKYVQGEPVDLKLLEILSNCNWENQKQKILSRISRHIHHKNRLTYPEPCLIHIGDFAIEFLPKSNKPATIPHEVRANIPSTAPIFSIRVKISLRDTNTQKFVNVLDNLQMSKATDKGNVNATNTSENTVADTQSAAINVTGISGFSHLQIKRSQNTKLLATLSKPVTTLTTLVHKPGTSHVSVPSVSLPPQINVSKPTVSPPVVSSSLSFTQQKSNQPLRAQTPVVHAAPSSKPNIGTSISASGQASQELAEFTTYLAKAAEAAEKLAVKIPTTSVSQKALMASSTTGGTVPTAVLSQSVLTVSTVFSSLPAVSILKTPVTAIKTLLMPAVTSCGSQIQTCALSSAIDVIATAHVTSTTSVTTSKPCTSSQENMEVSKKTKTKEEAKKTKTKEEAIPAIQSVPLRAPVSLSSVNVQDKVCVIGPKSSPVTLLGPFTSPSNIPKMLPQMKIVHSKVLDKEGKPLIQLVPYSGPVVTIAKPVTLTSMLKAAPVITPTSSAVQVIGGVSIMNPTNVYTISNVVPTTTNVSHVSNTSVTQSSMPAMSVKVQSPLFPSHGDQILLVSSEDKDLKLLSKIKSCERNTKENYGKSVLPEEKLDLKRKSSDDEHLSDENKKFKPTEPSVHNKNVDMQNVKEEDSVLAKILLSSEHEQTYAKYRDIPFDNMKDGKNGHEENPSKPKSVSDDKAHGNQNLEDWTDKPVDLSLKGNRCIESEDKMNGANKNLELNVNGREKIQKGESDSDNECTDDSKLQIAGDLDISSDNKSDESDATVAGGIESDSKEMECDNEKEDIVKDSCNYVDVPNDASSTSQNSESLKSDEIDKTPYNISCTDNDLQGSESLKVVDEKNANKVIHIQDSPVKKLANENYVTSSHIDQSKVLEDVFDQTGDLILLDDKNNKNEDDNLGTVISIKENESIFREGKPNPEIQHKRKLSSEEDHDKDVNKKLKSEEAELDSEEEMCMNVEDTDDMAVVIPNDEDDADCVEIVNSSDEDVDVMNVPEGLNAAKILREQTGNELHNPHCSVHSLGKQPHVKRKANLQTISNVFKDDIEFREVLVKGQHGGNTKRNTVQKTKRERKRREELRQSFKALAESMYGEDRDNTRYCQILNHTEPKVQLLQKAKEKANHMTEIDRMLTIETQTATARNMLLKRRLDKLKDYIIKERGMPWMILQAHLDKISKVCKKIFQNMPAILKKRAQDQQRQHHKIITATPTNLDSGNKGQFSLQTPVLGRYGKLINDGPVPIQMVSSEQVRNMAKSNEMSRSLQQNRSNSNRPDIYIDYAEEENEIREDLLRREETGKRKQIHSINAIEDTFDIGDLPRFMQKAETNVSCDFSVEERDILDENTGEIVHVTDNDSQEEDVKTLDEPDGDGLVSTFKIMTNHALDIPYDRCIPPNTRESTSSSVVEVTMSDSGKVSMESKVPLVSDNCNVVMDSNANVFDNINDDPDDGPKLVITDVKSLSLDAS